MNQPKLPLIEIGYQVFVPARIEEVGAVRAVVPMGRPELVINIEGHGDFTIPLSAVQSVLEKKVVLNPTHLGAAVLHAIHHAHDKEEAGL